MVGHVAAVAEPAAITAFVAHLKRRMTRELPAGREGRAGQKRLAARPEANAVRWAVSIVLGCD